MSNIPLKEYFEQRLADFRSQMEERDRRYSERFQATDEKTSLALTASEKAVTKAEIATEKRFDSVNEFRGSLKDQAATLLPRAEADSKFKMLEDKIDELKKDKQSNARWTFQQVLTILALLAATVGLFLRYGK